MKRHLLAVLKRELDPIHCILVCLVLVAVVLTAKVLTDRVLLSDDYAMEETEMYLPAL
jgi:hypothetical protein